MKVGLLTACLPRVELDELIPWAARAGLQGLELAAWPPGGPWYSASHAPVAGLTPERAESLRALLDAHGIAVSALAYYENNLDPDTVARERHLAHLRACIEAAPLLGTTVVCTFVGRDPGRSVAENLRSAEAIFAPLVDRAGELGVVLAIENCFMNGWHPDGYAGNLAYSPELWEWLFAQGLQLNYDPSHLPGLGIDPLAALVPYMDHVAHFHAKDVQWDISARDRWGFLGPAVDREDPWDAGWWQYRLPGRGGLDWRELIGALAAAGWDGTLSIEHEDADYEGSEELVREGVAIAVETLQTALRR